MYITTYIKNSMWEEHPPQVKRECNFRVSVVFLLQEFSNNKYKQTLKTHYSDTTYNYFKSTMN